MLLVPNKYVIVPVSEEIVLTRAEITTGKPRAARVNEFDMFNQTIIGLPYIPPAAEWVEIYLQGQRIVNTKLAVVTGGFLCKSYNIEQNTITFEEPVTGTITVICDTDPVHDALSTIVDIKNIQKESNATGIYCEPIVLVQPKYGFARLTTDRQSIAYMPNRGFRGTDSFSYTLITQNGQLSTARCVFIVSS